MRQHCLTVLGLALAANFFGCTIAPPPHPAGAAPAHPAHTLERCSQPPIPILRKPSPLRWYSAHRGLPTLFPDNSLEGIQAAEFRGFPLVEVDVRPTKDNVLVLFHDSSVQVQTLPGLPASVQYGTKVKEVPFKELKSAHLPGNPDSRVPSLSEALLLVTEGCSALQLDIKNESPQVVEAVARAVVHSHAQAHVLLQFKSIEAAQVIKDGFPSLAVLIRVRSKEELLQALELHPEVIELERLAPSKELVSIAHFTGAKVLYNPLGQSADTPATGRSLFDAGIDIVLTERPSAAQEGETKYLDPDP